MPQTLPPWWPKQPAIYDINKSWMENMEEGPFFTGEIPERILPDRSEWIDFLGYQVASPLGVPAGPLLNSNWIELAANLGFDIPVYKTIRYYEHPAHPAPNVVAVDVEGQLTPGNLPPFVHQLPEPPLSIEMLGITNSFGNPSRSPEYLREDIARANSKLHEGQVMIVSVFGTTPEEFVKTALLAKESGAKIIEANFSCPNVSKEDGALYASPTTVFELSSQIKKAIGDIPLVIKTGIFPDTSLMRASFTAAANAGVQAICGINTISMKVTPPLPGNRETCGICGGPIHEAALSYIREARHIIDEEKLNLTLIATGGAMLPEHLQNFLNAGAAVAMTATGMMWDPFLAMRFQNLVEAR